MKRVRTATLSILFVLTLYLVASHYIRAQESLIEEVVIEQHSEPFPRVSAPSITRLPNGSVLAVFSYASLINDSLSGIWGKYSDDNGQTWGDKFQIKSSTNSYKAYSSACLISGNKVFLFYDRWEAFEDTYQRCSVWSLLSVDNGQTWGNDTRVDPGTHDYTLASFSAIKMRNGTLICPISWLWEHQGDLFSWRSSVLRSDDDGESWVEGNQIPDYGPSITGLDEPSAVELSNGSLYCVLRTGIRGTDGHHTCSLSNDNGLTWTTCVEVNEMPSVNTSPAVFRYSWNPNIVLASWINRTNVDYASYTFNRRPLVVALSEDDCATWKSTRVIDESANRSMNEMSFALTSDGNIILGYRRCNDTVGGVADIQKDGVIDIYDALLLSWAFGSTPSSPRWNSNADLNNDGVIDVYDAIVFVRCAATEPPVADDAVTKRFTLNCLLAGAS